MITLQVNGKTEQLNHQCSVADALIIWGYNSQNIAVAVNNEFVPRIYYLQQQLAENDLVDIVTPIQGG